MTDVFRSLRGDGAPIHPGTGIVPILKEVGTKRLSVIGTGFYITRYGLVATAKHVVEDLTDDGKSLTPSFVLHLQDDDAIVLRPIRRAHYLHDVDLAVVQADNFVNDGSRSALQNLRAVIAPVLPRDGTPLVTYAYPENAILDFNDTGLIPVVRGDYFAGGVLRFVNRPEHPLLPFPYLETTVEVRSGASGGPVLLANGSVVGVNCRGWDFRGGEHEGQHLSYIAPIALLLDLEVDTFQLPRFSWEGNQFETPLPPRTTIRELVRRNIILSEPPIA